MSASNLHTIWAELFLSTLRRAGVVDIVASPGSRSTPLALAAATDHSLRLHVILDERVAAFFALGQARQSGHPTVLICTSGTAPAHYFPAIMEAAQSHIPLLIVTADRPWEDYDCAAAQTVDQVKLFGDYVRHYAELGLPDSQPAALRALVRIAVQAVLRCQHPLPGPVHINARFRKPLEPIPSGTMIIPKDQLSLLLESIPATAFASRSEPGTELLMQLQTLCASKRRGVIVCGPAHCGTDQQALRHAVIRLARKTGYPVWAESTSGVRFGGGAGVCGGFDAFLRTSGSAGRNPQLLIEIGGPVVSSSYASFASRLVDCTRVVVAPFGWNDPIGTALHVNADPVHLLHTVCDALQDSPPDLMWNGHIVDAERRVWESVQAGLADGVLSEGRVAKMLVDALPSDAVLAVGNSLPVRDLDLFCPPDDKPLRVLHQRGASGIDGLISAIAGVRVKTDHPVALLLGDLSAQHDLGGFAALAEATGPLVVVIVQNGGGRIFQQLPIGENTVAAPHFSKLFLTPQAIDFAACAAAFGIAFLRVQDVDSYRSALWQGLASARPLVIEAVVPFDDGTKRRKRIWGRVAKAEPDKTSAQEWFFLHGFLGGPQTWTDLTSALSVTAHCDFLPGHGIPPWIIPNADFDSVVTALAERLPERTVSLCGYSMGARLALAIALRFPQKVSSLVLVSVDPGMDAADSRTARTVWEDELAHKVLSDGIASFVADWENLPLFASQKRLSDTALSRQREGRYRHDPQAIAWTLRTLGTGRMPNLWPLLPTLKIPVTVITGALDEKFTAIAQKMKRTNPRIEHVAIPEAGHNPVLEAPVAVLSTLITHKHAVTEKVCDE